jgi:hypothetical protein
MARLGFVVVRWFVFCDGRAGIVYDDRNLPSGVDALFFGDVDTGLEIARDNGIRVDFVLLDHHWLFRGIRHTLADPVTGDLLEAQLPEGRARILVSERGRDALFERVFAPLVRRYAEGGERADLRDQIFAFELMNEPDFVIDEWERDLSPRVTRPLSFALFADLVARLSDLVHAHSPALVTLGGARLHNLWAWDDDALGLDVLQVHRYPDPQRADQDDDLIAMPASQLGVRRRVIVGEFPGYADVETVLESALAHGYLGAWPWSFSATDDVGRPDIDALRRFGARHPELVNPRFTP